MKFEKPVMNVTMFSAEDILTTSGGPETTVSQAGYIMEGSCTGSAADNLLDDCAG